MEKTQFGVYCQESNFVAIDCGAPSPHEKQTENRGNRLNTVLCCKNWSAKIDFYQIRKVSAFLRETARTRPYGEFRQGDATIYSLYYLLLLCSGLTPSAKSLRLLYMPCCYYSNSYSFASEVARVSRTQQSSIKFAVNINNI